MLFDTLCEALDPGALVQPEVHTYDKKDELLRIFQKYNIPYEYYEDEQAFVVYGYK